MSVALYINPKGQPVTHSSYSARSSFKRCPREFELTRIKGYAPKEKRAAPLFGKCVEAAVQFYEENKRQPGTGIEHFTQLWKEVALLPEFKQLVYKDSTEKDWESLMRTGREMLLLYEFRAPFLPISTSPRAQFQQVWRKKIFPNSEYDILENKAIVDILSFPSWDHPLLPSLKIEPFGALTECKHQHPYYQCRECAYRPLIIDMKTSGEDLNTELVSLDPQLEEYAWQGRIPDVGFLWFVKKSHEVEKGSRVTLMEDTGPWHPGYELQVLWVSKGDIFVGELDTFTEYKKVSHDVRGKALEELKAKWAEQPNVAKVVPSSITKQRLQFAAVRLDEEDMNEIGREVAQTTVEMIRAHQEQYYPKRSGIRFPNQICNNCYMRWICLKDSKQRDQKLTRQGEEWLDGNFDED